MPEELKKAAHDPHFEAWRKNSVFPHKVPGYAIVTLSLKPVGGPPGDATADQMDAIADLAEKYSFGEIRVGHEQNLALPHVARRDLPALWRVLDKIGLATPNVNLVTDIIACPGLDYCSLANARSIPIAQELTRRFANHDTANLIGKLHVNISGCINACGHHHVVHIADDAEIPPDGAILIPAARLFLENAEALSRRVGQTGVIWPNNRDVDDLVPYLDRLAVVALVFPSFRDGRAYSQARLLRERYGYEGELRATGQVLRDQFVFMLRAGFDAFEVKKDSDAEAFAATVKRYSVCYQPTGDGRLTALHRRMQLRHSESASQ